MGSENLAVISGREERIDRNLLKIRRCLGPLICGLLDEPTVIEVMLNPDGLVWVERLGEVMKPVGSLSEGDAEGVVTAVASLLRTTVTHDSPILECELPLDGSRFEALLPPVVPRPVFTIRRMASRVFTLAEYVAQGVMTDAQHQVLRDAVANRQNVLVAGGTGSGKTTLTNAILAEIAAQWPDDRIVIIEDTNELQCSVENKVTLRTADDVSMQRLLAATMRLRPDRITVGEVRGKEALDLLKAWNTGHPGGVATVHANDGRGALRRLESLVAEGTLAPQQETIAAAVNVVAVIGKTPEGRRLKEVLKVHSWDGQNYVMSQL